MLERCRLQKRLDLQLISELRQLGRIEARSKTQGPSFHKKTFAPDGCRGGSEACANRIIQYLLKALSGLVGSFLQKALDTRIQSNRRPHHAIMRAMKLLSRLHTRRSQRRSPAIKLVYCEACRDRALAQSR